MAVRREIEVLGCRPPVARIASWGSGRGCSLAQVRVSYLKCWRSSMVTLEGGRGRKWLIILGEEEDWRSMVANSPSIGRGSSTKGEQLVERSSKDGAGLAAGRWERGSWDGRSGNGEAEEASEALEGWR